MKRIIRKAGLIILTAVFLAGCGKSTSDSGKIVAESISDIATETPAGEVSDDEVKELTLLEKVMPLAEVVDEFVGNLYGSEVHEYFYTVTDLNQNGQPEILFAAFLGSGRYTYLSIYEADSEFKSAKRLEEFDCISEDAPDIIKDKLEGIYDSKEGTYSYFDTDYVRYGFTEHSSILMALSFGEKNTVRRYLFEEYELTDDDEICMTYFDSERNEISEEEYYTKLNDIEKSYNIEYKINWEKLDELLSDMDARAEQLAEVFESQEFKVLSEEEMAKSSIESGDPELDVEIRRVVNLSEEEEFENAEWVEEDICFRVAIQLVEEPEDTADRYRHNRDYIFVKREGRIEYVMIDYPGMEDWHLDRYAHSACDFFVSYVDVTFDQNKDIIIYLGGAGPRFNEVCCAYVYEDGQYVYKKSFEGILNFSINEEENLIYGSYYDGMLANACIEKYSYENGEFVLDSSEEYSEKKYRDFCFYTYVDKDRIIRSLRDYVEYKGEMVKLADLLDGKQIFYCKEDVIGDSHEEEAFLSGGMLYLLDRKNNRIVYEGVSYEQLVKHLNEKGILYKRDGGAPKNTYYQYFSFDENNEIHTECTWAVYDANDNNVFDEQDYYEFNDKEVSYVDYQKMTEKYSELSQYARAWICLREK